MPPPSTSKERMRLYRETLKNSGKYKEYQEKNKKHQAAFREKVKTQPKWKRELRSKNTIRKRKEHQIRKEGRNGGGGESSVMMPALDHCINNTSEMTTLSNTFEVFDSYKHRDDKDSDEESFHLPLDDDETELKVPDTVRNGNETEEDILNKFDSVSGAPDHIDSQLEESLLNEDEEEQKHIKDEVKDELDPVSPPTTNSEAPEIVENGIHLEELKQEEKSEEENLENVEADDSCRGQTKLINDTTADDPEGESVCDEDKLTENKTVDETPNQENCDVHDSENVVKANTSKTDEVVAVENKDVPKVDVEENLSPVVEEASVIDTSDDKRAQIDVDKNVDTSKVDDSLEKTVEISKEVDVKPNESNTSDELTSKDSQSETKTDEDSSSREGASSEEKSEEKTDDFSKHNEDSEDLFDISVIRDANEDNAESAYNEAHPEEEEDDRTEEKMEEESVHEKASNDEEEEEMDIDKNEEHLKSDDVDIEETNLKMESDGTKDSGSDGESENSNKTDLVKINTEQKELTEPAKSVVARAKECRLDEVTGNLIGDDGKEISYEEHLNDEDAADGHKSAEDPVKNSLKRPLADGAENGAAKKSRTELSPDAPDVEIKEVDKPKEKLPLRALLSLSEFMKTRKHTKRLTMHDLEEFCVQKICEAIVHKSELGDVHHQLKLQEQLIETMRKEIQQLTKQTRDLEIVNKKLMNDLKQQTTTQKPLNPLKITRSVGLQVKFTPTFEANVKRRQLNAATASQKAQTQTTPNRGPRTLPNVNNLSVARQMPSPQKQQPQPPKTPLLSQALQSRRAGITDTTNKTPSPVVRAKPADPKSGPPSASVIDLTDEDDKKEKSKNSPIKMVPPKSITVPLRTTPMRVNATPQGLRLTTSQGKGSPITSVVTSSTPQVMYVVQSSPQNVLASTLGPKAVVVNFQSTNGVLTSTLNGSAVSVIPKQQNTIQLKTVAPGKAIQNNKVVKVANKHPAPLPAPPVVRVTSEKSLKPIPPKPHLTIRKTDTGIILQWKMPYELDMYEVIASYQLYAYQETSAMPSTDMWRKVGDVKALALPMACTLTQFADKNKYYFAVRPVDIHKRIGMFSEPEEISL